MKFIIIHGAFGSPEGNWIPELREKLEALEQEVIVPQFPVEDWNEFTKSGPTVTPQRQSLDSWFETFAREVLPKIRKGESLCFIGHSLGCVFILHVVAKYQLKLDSAIFVSPFMDCINSTYWQFDAANRTFYKTDFDFDNLQKLIPTSYVLYSNDDLYVSKPHPTLFAKAINSSLIFVRRAGHMNSEVNLNEFPLVFDLCATRIDLSLYQRYLKHLSERYASDYLKKTRERIIHLKPEDIFDEAKFHFENLHKRGFCTFLSFQADWDPENRYYQDCRKAAGRKNVKDLTRVILLKNQLDLQRPTLRKQIKLDLEAGIKVYLCMFDEIKNEVTDPDFGIWDSDYLCTIHYDDNYHMTEIILSSRDEDLLRAKKWESYILAKSTRITNYKEDLDQFIRVHS